jgi:hypothetical protein
LWYAKVNPHSFKEELGSICPCDVLLANYEDGHIQKLINEYKYAIIAFLGGRNARHVIHRDGFPRLLESRKRGV